MCGFAVMIAISGRELDTPALVRMSAALSHRGPDDEGLHSTPRVGLAFRRLSILDLTPAGHQPMLSDDGQLALVFNGEIYNYLELRAELIQLGVRFRSNSDTEVLLRSYEHWGTDCVRRFNGMWAFALLDKRRGRVVVSRDRLGVKPLFAFRSGDYLLFASELKAIVASGLAPTSLEWPSAARFLVRGALDTDDKTFLSAVQHVPAGSFIEIDCDGAGAPTKFWRLGNASPDITDPSAALRSTLTDSVRLRLRSDVPVGVFLSGGLDSTSILSLMARELEGQGEQPPTAFTYQSPDFDERRYIDDTIAQTRARLLTLEVPPARLWDSVEEMLRFQDEPVHSPTAVVGYELMRMARTSGVTVVLNGQGADETLGGYFSYFRQYWYSMARRGALVAAAREVRRHHRVHGSRTIPLLRDVAERLVTRPVASTAWYKAMGTKRKSRRRDPGGAFQTDLHRLVPGESPIDGDAVSEVLRASVEVKPLPLYLRVEDRNSMAHSVEARLPFCDYRMAELGWALPLDWKLRGPWNKYALRQGMAGIIPESVRTRPDKMGFPTSARRWIQNEWHAPIRDLLSSAAARQRGIYHPERVEALLDQHRNGDADHSSVLFRMAQFELLAKRYGW